MRSPGAPALQGKIQVLHWRALLVLAVLFLADAVGTFIGLQNPAHVEETPLAVIVFDWLGVLPGIILMSVAAYAVIAASMWASYTIWEKTARGLPAYVTTVIMVLGIKAWPVLNNTALILKNGVR